MANKSNELKEIKVKNGVVIAKRLNVRESGSSKANIIKVIDEGEKLQVYIGSKTKWYEVITSDGTHGYCMKEFVEVEK